MKFIIKTRDFVESLKNISNFINPNTSKPYLSGVNIKAYDNKIDLIATDSNNSYFETIENVNVKEPGNILIQCKLLFNIVSKINEESIDINQIDESILQLKTPKFSCELNLLDLTLFPLIKYQYEGWNKIILTLPTLENITNRVAPFINTAVIVQNQTTRGINFSAIDEKQMECIASDGFRLSYYKFDYQGDPITFNVGPEVIKFAVSILQSQKNKSIEIYVNNFECILKSDNVIAKFRFFSGIYPKIVNAVLSEQKYSFSVKLDDLYNALNRGSVFVSNDLNPVVNIKVSNNKLFIKLLSQEKGNSFEEIDLISSNTDSYEVILNHKLLIDLISKIKAENISFNFNDSLSPIVIKSENQYFINLIVPRRG